MDGLTIVLVLVVGGLAALLTVRFMRGPAGADAEYKPIVIDREAAEAARAKISSDGLAKPLEPGAPRTKEPTGSPLRTKEPTGSPLRTKEPTGSPLRTKEPSAAPQTKAPSDPQIEIPPSAHTSLSGPIDLASRLGATSDVAIRPPLPEPEPVPPDQIAVAPESGLTIRKRNPSTMPPPDPSGPGAPAVAFAIRTRTPTGASMPSVAAALANPEPVKLRGRLNYALTTAAFSGAGITAHREDGFAKLVAWRDVVGIVARRLPDVAPYDGAAFIDVVSTAGATLRIVPWTDVTGHAPSGDATERMRALLQLISTQCHDAQLDAATKAFLQRTAKPAQLPDEKTLAAHDAKLR